MNPLDPDYDPKGFRGGRKKGGRGEAPNLEAIIGDRYDEKPTPADYEMAARGVGCKPEDVPRKKTYIELVVWVNSMHVLRGSKEHFQEFGDRVSPKPSRTAGASGTGSTRKSNARASQSEAEKWFAELEGYGSGDDDDSDLL